MYLYNLLNGELNYPKCGISLDIAFLDEKIYLEYDGGGHENEIVFGTYTEEEFIKNQRNRWYALYRSGWKEIRIISIKDLLPSDDKILEMIQYAKKYVNTGHSWIKFDIDNSKIINSLGEFDYNFGKIRKITKKDFEEQFNFKKVYGEPS